MINKFEATGIFVCVGIMAFALFLMRIDVQTNLLSATSDDSQTATIINASEDGAEEKLLNSVKDSIDMDGGVNNMIIDDVVIGEGPEVKAGDSISVNYIGTLQNGQQFDNSYTTGTPFTFTVGEGRVIKGWDEGVVGMKKGGQRILVIPADLAYGTKAVGPIPANATLVFSIELLDIKN